MNKTVGHEKAEYAKRLAWHGPGVLRATMKEQDEKTEKATTKTPRPACTDREKQRSCKGNVFFKGKAPRAGLRNHPPKNYFAP
jgi:hypothetical protein